MRLLIITEGSEKHGLGHLNRVKSFVVSNKESAHDIKVIAFIDDSLKSIFNEIGNDVLIENDYQKVISFTKKYNPDFVIFDLLKIDQELFRFLKKGSYSLVSFSPIFNFLEDIDILFTRGALSTPGNVKVFSGMEYIIIGNHVEKISSEQYMSNLNLEQLPIAITMGGTDAPNKALKILEGLISFNKSLLIWVLLGEGYRHSYTQLVNVIKKNSLHEIILARTNKSMWKILKNAVFTVTAGGLTAYEAAFAGLPSITIVEKEEHLGLLKDLFDNNCAIDGGIFEKFESENLLKTINNLYEDRNKILKMRDCSNDIIGINGSENIMRKLEEIVNY